MNTNYKKAKEKLINAGLRLDGDEEVLFDEGRSKSFFK
jgi:hypothetical protein